MSNVFTFKYLEKELKTLKENGYTFTNCIGYYKLKEQKKIPDNLIVLRVDVDLSVKKAEKLLNIFNHLDIVSTFFIRLHAREYNPFSFENYRIIKSMINSGHEIGYHSEVIDESVIWDEDATACLIRDIDVFNRMYDVKINGVASHGGSTGYNNLDFWKNKRPKDLNLLYEGYDLEPTYNIFQESFYISDSEWIRWKCYDKGVKVVNDHRSPSEHIMDQHSLIHLLIHPDTYYENHIYDNER